MNKISFHQLISYQLHNYSTIKPHNKQSLFRYSHFKSHHSPNFNYNRQNQIQMTRKKTAKRHAPQKQETQLYDRVTKIQTEVLQRISKLKNTNKIAAICQHLDTTTSECQKYDPSINYYDRYWKRFLINEVGRRTVEEWKKQTAIFYKKLTKIQILFKKHEMELQPFHKNKNKKINSKLTIFCHHCHKSYLDQQAFLLHKKIKHQEHSQDQEEDGGNKDINVIFQESFPL